MKIFAIADQHGYLPQVDFMPEADLLIIAGDVTPVDLPHDPRTQRGWLKKRFGPWLAELPFPNKVVIAGNHDYALQEVVDKGKWGKSYMHEHYTTSVEAITDAGAHYLEDTTVEIDGLKIHGSPWTPRFMDWAYMMPDAALFEKWKLIPEDTDVLVVHGPPLGFGDYSTFGNEYVGSSSLRRRLGQLESLKLAFFGHIHNGWGIWEDHGASETLFPNQVKARMHNVSLRDDQYNLHDVARLRSATHYVEVEDVR